MHDDQKLNLDIVQRSLEQHVEDFLAFSRMRTAPCRRDANGGR